MVMTMPFVRVVVMIMTVIMSAAGIAVCMIMAVMTVIMVMPMVMTAPRAVHMGRCSGLHGDGQGLSPHGGWRVVVVVVVVVNMRFGVFVPVPVTLGRCISTALWLERSIFFTDDEVHAAQHLC